MDHNDPQPARRLFPVEKLTGGASLKGRLVFSLWRVLRKQAKLPTLRHLVFSKGTQNINFFSKRAIFATHPT